MLRLLQNHVRIISRIVMVCAIVGAYFCSTGLLEVQKEFDTSYEMRDANSKTFISIIEAEASQRGYIITGKDQYLKPYYRGVGLIPEYIRTYESLPLDPDQKAFYKRLRPLIDRKIKEMDSTIENRRVRGFDPTIIVGKTDEGQVLMDEMRSAFQSERQRAEAAREELRGQLIIMAQGTIYSVLLGILGVLIMWMGSEKRRRRGKKPTPVPTPTIEPEFVERFRSIP